MTPKTKRTLLIAAGIFVVVNVAVGWYIVSEFNRKPKDISAAEADIRVSAAELFAAFETNEKEANAKYLNKVIEVSGPVGEISSDQNGGKMVVVRTPEMMFGIACSMLSSNNDKVDALQEGQNVTIKGLCTGYTMDVVLTNGSLVQ